jgi:hypothetical protein
MQDASNLFSRSTPSYPTPTQPNEITPQPGPLLALTPLPSLSACCCEAHAIKRRVRNVRRLQLVCLNLFYERIQLDMPCCASEPTSKPVQPLTTYFKAPGQPQ